MQSVTKPLVTFKKGDLVKGTITKLTPQEVLVDIDAKTDAVVLEKDKKLLRGLLGSLKVGDSVTVSVLNPESDLGYPVVSLRRFLSNETWDKLATLQKEQKSIEVTVQTETRAGYVVATTDGMSGFLPLSQVTTPSKESMVGKTLTAFVLEVNRPTKKVIFSQKQALTSEGFKKAVSYLKQGQRVQATITTIAAFGMFAAISIEDGSFIDGLIHVSEVSWQKIENLEEAFAVGNLVEAVVIGKDFDAKRIDLSIKQLQIDPYAEKLKGYTPDKKVSGTVKEVMANGVVLILEEGIEGFIRKEKIPPTTKYQVGQELAVTVDQVEEKKHRVLLSPVLTTKFVGYR